MTSKVSTNLRLSKVPSVNLPENKARCRNTLVEHQSETVTVDDKRLKSAHWWISGTLITCLHGCKHRESLVLLLFDNASQVFILTYRMSLISLTSPSLCGERTYLLRCSRTHLEKCHSHFKVKKTSFRIGFWEICEKYQKVFKTFSKLGS